MCFWSNSWVTLWILQWWEIEIRHYDNDNDDDDDADYDHNDKDDDAHDNDVDYGDDDDDDGVDLLSDVVGHQDLLDLGGDGHRIQLIRQSRHLV